jgi:outer membrane lipoprotein-sorting protein
MRVLPVLAIALIALSACGGASTTTTAGATTPAATSAAAATQAASTPAPAASTASGPSILDLLKAGKATTYKATYKWSITAGGQTQTSEQTWYYKAPNSRFDFSAGPGATFSVFSLADGTYLCTNAGGQAFCQKSAGQAAFGQNPAADFALQLQGDPSKFNASFTGSQTIAGQQAQCYSVKSVAGGAFADVSSCYSANGIPLKTTINSQGTTLVMEATAFSATVTDADFKLPGPVR